jgi:hypothetical protein
MIGATLNELTFALIYVGYLFMHDLRISSEYIFWLTVLCN